MHLFPFEPGDSVSYRILFGRMPGQGLVPFFTVFGIAEGSSEPGVWYAFDTDRVSEAAFRRHIDLFATLHSSTYWTAWRVWLALTGQPDDANAASHLPDWKADWRRQLPAAAMG